MIRITLPDGSTREYETGIKIIDVAKDISEGLARVNVGAEVNGEVKELNFKLQEDCRVSLLKFNDENGAEIFRHTSSHILAQAVKRLWHDTKLAIGPAIKDGFYYDFDTEHRFTTEDFEKIESEMKKIVKENLELERFELPRNEAIELMKEKSEDYKVDLIKNLPEDAVISFYKQGDFVDLCAGPHLQTTKKIKAIKLLKIAGAYWKGDENNKMLQRIYGTSFEKNKDLQNYLDRLEEAKKRDHNKLGRELEIFTTVESVGQGLPLLMPKGAKIIQILQRFVEDEEEKRGYQLTKTPFMAKSDLYKISGHWQHYKESMFVLGDEEKDQDSVLGLRPMTCPFHFMIYKSKLRSYKDLPIRYNETSTLFRNESSGEMHGLIRLRQFTISEGHIICTPRQLVDEFKEVVNLVSYMMNILGLSDDIWFRFSKWDPNNKDKYIGDFEIWEESQKKMKQILDDIGLDYVEAEGEAAFYGPKLDVQVRNVWGKEDTMITIQIDFALSEKFDMFYIDKSNERKRPYIIHRTSLGCYERTLAFLIEKYAGAFPIWLAPVQVKILPISDKYNDYAQNIKKTLERNHIRVESDYRAEKIGYKIREAQLQKIPYMLVVGEKEEKENTVSVRERGKGDAGTKNIDEFIKIVTKKANSRENVFFHN